MMIQLMIIYIKKKKEQGEEFTRRRKVLKLHLQTSQRAASWKAGGSVDIIYSVSDLFSFSFFIGLRFRFGFSFQFQLSTFNLLFDFLLLGYFLLSGCPMGYDPNALFPHTMSCKDSEPFCGERTIFFSKRSKPSLVQLFYHKL